MYPSINRLFLRTNKQLMNSMLLLLLFCWGINVEFGISNTVVNKNRAIFVFRTHSKAVSSSLISKPVRFIHQQAQVLQNDFVLKHEMKKCKISTWLQTIHMFEDLIVN